MDWRNETALAAVVLALLLAEARTCAAETNVVTGAFATSTDATLVVDVDVLSDGGAERMKLIHYDPWLDEGRSSWTQSLVDSTVTLVSFEPPGAATWSVPDEDDGDYGSSLVWGDGEAIPASCSMTLHYSVVLTNTLNGLESTQGYPVGDGQVPLAIRMLYRDTAGTYTQKDAPGIVDLASSLVDGCVRQTDAAARVIDWCVENLVYYGGELTEDETSALSVLNDPTHRASCEGYTHMALALLRAAGIPARHVTGMTTSSDPYVIPGPGPLGWEITHGSGLHTWLEVYYPNLGWIPYDPTHAVFHYVDTRRVAHARGIDHGDSYTLACEFDYPSGAPEVVVSIDRSTFVDADTPDLEYYSTLRVPDPPGDSPAFADRVTHSSVAPHARSSSLEFASVPAECPRICPSGDMDNGGAPPVSMVMTVLDRFGYPIEDYDDCYVEATASGSSDFVLCCAFEQPTVQSTTIALPDAPTDADGRAWVSARWGGGGAELDSDLCFASYVDGGKPVPDTLCQLVRSPDLNADCKVDLFDFVLFSQYYNTTTWQADFNCSGMVDVADFVTFSQHYNHRCGSSRTEAIPPELIAALGTGGLVDQQPLSFSLLPNTPNPFNPVTEISYTVPAGGSHVSVSVFNLSGRLTRTLVDGEVSAGTHTLVWDGTDGQGGRVPSGVYFYEIEAPGFTERRTMVLLK